MIIKSNLTENTHYTPRYYVRVKAATGEPFELGPFIDEGDAWDTQYEINEAQLGQGPLNVEELMQYNADVREYCLNKISELNDDTAS